jgi:hypothetical protein
MQRISMPAFQYDAAKHRLWILGQRCHHGAVGALIAASAATWLAANTVVVPKGASARTLMIVTVGGALMLHDLKDLPIWFERGTGSQP